MVSPIGHLNSIKFTHKFKHSEIPTSPRSLGENERGFAEVRCTLGRESIVYPVTHVIIPLRPLSSRTNPYYGVSPSSPHTTGVVGVFHACSRG